MKTMQKFCITCGQKLEATHNVCIHCGTPVDQEETRKKPLSNKQKLIWKIAAGIIVFMIGFSLWANHYHSAASVEKRFEKAVDGENSRKLSKLMVHEDGSPVEKHEAEAFIKLVAERGQDMKNRFTSIEEAGKFLGIYNAHKVKVMDQLAFGPDADGLSYTFNGEEVEDFERTDDTVTFGPLAPGIYNVDVSFEGAFGDFETEGEVILDQAHDVNEIDIDIPIEDVVFFVENYQQLDPKTTYVQVGDEKFPISEEGETEAVGPVVIDGSQEATVHVEMPWGDVASDPFEIVDKDMGLVARFVSPDQFDEALEVIENFGEQYVEALAKDSTKPLKNVAKDVKQFVKNDFNDFYDAYTGKLDKIAVDELALFVETDEDEPKMSVPVNYTIQEDYHDVEESPNLGESLLTCELELSFDADDESWHIDGIQEFGLFGGFDETESWKASGEMYGPDEETVAKAEKEAFENDLENFIKDYTDANVEAINERDFNIVADYIAEDGPRYDEARDYIDYLESEDIYETWLGSELEDVEEKDDHTWETSVIEKFEIIRPDTVDVKEFRTKLIIKEIDGELFVDELIETNEI